MVGKRNGANRAQPVSYPYDYEIERQTRTNYVEGRVNHVLDEGTSSVGPLIRVDYLSAKSRDQPDERLKRSCDAAIKEY